MFPRRYESWSCLIKLHCSLAKKLGTSQYGIPSYYSNCWLPFYFTWVLLTVHNWVTKATQLSSLRKTLHKMKQKISKVFEDVTIFLGFHTVHNQVTTHPTQLSRNLTQEDAENSPNFFWGCYPFFGFYILCITRQSSLRET